MNVCEVRDICKAYRNFSLKHVTFSLPRGYILGYVGRNGAGKTTTLNCITHICKADSGEVEVNGLRYEEDPVRYKEEIGFVGDESYFPAGLRLGDVKRIMKDFYPTFREGDFDEMAARWGLPERKKIDTFSRGMKVKLMFASVFSRDTSLLILDEATNGLDPVMREEILGLLQEYIADGERSVLFSTHQLEDLDEIADYIAFINDGELLLVDARDELLEKWVLVKGAEEELPGSLAGEMMGITRKPYGFTALLSSEEAHRIPAGFVVEKPTLQDLMIHVIRDRKERVR